MDSNTMTINSERTGPFRRLDVDEGDSVRLHSVEVHACREVGDVDALGIRALVKRRPERQSYHADRRQKSEGGFDEHHRADCDDC